MTEAVNIRPLGDADRRAAANVYVMGLLDEEIRPLMPRHVDRAGSVFAELITPSPNAWVAESHGGEVVGLALCQEPPGVPLRMTDWQIYRRYLPLASTIRAWLVARYLYRVHPKNGSMYLQSLVVAQDWQGRGVGQALVRFVCDRASERGHASVTLNVVDRNKRARRLYEHLGFSMTQTTPTRFYRPLVGWGAVSAMEKCLGRVNPVTTGAHESDHLVGTAHGGKNS
jgi:ribosomal protein S18 acetylase RimI-like enzyme